MNSGHSVRLLAVGDVFLGDLPNTFGFGVGSMMARHGADFPFAHVREILRKGDVVIGNLESVISAHDRKRDPFERIVMRAQPEAAIALKNAGFHVLSFATNHTMQHGKAAVAETARLLADQGVAVCGVELPDEQIGSEVILERGRIRIGFLNFNLRPQQYFIDPPLWHEPTPEYMCESIGRLREKTDIVVVAMHWGDEFIDYPSPEQVSLAHLLVDSGAGLILGHHPHILQGIERYDGAVIAYSLGNFVFDMWQPRYRRSMILDIQLSHDGVGDFAARPLYINDSYQPVPVNGREAEEMQLSIHRLVQQVSDDASRMGLYRGEVARLTRQVQCEIYWHYLRNVHRYPSLRLWQNFLGAMRRRLWA